MLSTKKHYYLYLKDYYKFDLNLIKIKNKFSVIYDGNIKKSEIKTLKTIRKKCKKKKILFYIANNQKIANLCNADGLYISSYNKSYPLNTGHFDIIGSAHNYKEIFEKKKQGCKKIVFSRLFKTDYENKKSFLGISKFNLTFNISGFEMIPLGGIRLKNLNKLKLVRSDSFVLMSEVKKKPAIISRLF